MLGDINGLSLLADKKTRSISPENLTGEPGFGGKTALEDGSARFAARDLGTGWKVNPYRQIQPGETMVLADIRSQGAIRHIWLTPTGQWRKQIIRFYWDGSDIPSIECPIGDFFACGWGRYAPVRSLAVCVNPGSALNCYWPMPFYTRCLITLQNLNQEKVTIFYQVTFEEYALPLGHGYFHAAFHRVNPLLERQVFTILDRVRGKGQYVGTSMAWGVNNCGWWGEGEIKFFMDGDQEFPTICGTGTEDYFCGSYNFENQDKKQYEEFTTPYSGLAQVIRPDGLYQSQTRFSLYRWHITDPIYFSRDLAVTIQALGWRKDGRYLPLQDDISSVAYWYMDQPSKDMPPLPDPDHLEII